MKVNEKFLYEMLCESITEQEVELVKIISNKLIAKMIKIMTDVGELTISYDFTNFYDTFIKEQEYVKKSVAHKNFRIYGSILNCIYDNHIFVEYEEEDKKLKFYWGI